MFVKKNDFDDDVFLSREDSQSRVCCKRRFAGTENIIGKTFVRILLV